MRAYTYVSVVDGKVDVSMFSEPSVRTSPYAGFTLKHDGAEISVQFIRPTMDVVQKMRAVVDLLERFAAAPQEKDDERAADPTQPAAER